MNIKPAVAIASSVLLFAAGCAEDGHQAYYDESIAPSFSAGRVSDYTSDRDIPPPGAHTEVVLNPDVKGKFMAGGSVGEHASPSHGPGYNPAEDKASPIHGSGYSTEARKVSQAQSDNVIVAQVRESLQRDPEIALIAPNVQIAVNNGAVVLDGSVQSVEQKRQIEVLAKEASGVVAVNNQLKIISSQQQPAGMDNSNNAPLNPTGSADGVYRDGGNNAGSSTNELLNPPSGATELPPSDPGQKP